MRWPQIVVTTKHLLAPAMPKRTHLLTAPFFMNVSFLATAPAHHTSRANTAWRFFQLHKQTMVAASLSTAQTVTSSEFRDSTDGMQVLCCSRSAQHQVPHIYSRLDVSAQLRRSVLIRDIISGLCAGLTPQVHYAAPMTNTQNATDTFALS